MSKLSQYLQCPACGNKGTLFVGEGGYPTCGYPPCPSPEAASALLEQGRLVWKIAAIAKHLNLK